MPPSAHTPTVERTLHLVEMLLANPKGITPQEMLLHLDISRSTLFLMLRTLKSLGYIEQSEKRGRYRLGPRLEAWRASPSLVSQDLLTAFYMETSQKDWPETLALVLPSMAGPIVLAQAESSRQVRCIFTPGQVQPELRAAIEALNPEPPQEVKTNGYSLVQGPESIELALPVCRDGHRPEAVLLMSAPAFRWQVEQFLVSFLSELRAMAARLSYQLGAVIYAPFTARTETWSQPAEELDSTELTAFLHGPWTARLACIRPDGTPHVIPVWQEWDGEHFFIVAWHGSQWAEHVMQNPNVSLTVDEPWPPLRRVVARGRAFSIPESGDEHLQREQLLMRLTQRYLGQSAVDLTERVRLAFKILPEYLRGWQGIPWQNISSDRHI